jgi:tRNA (uracil-5-)-methyltransferase
LNKDKNREKTILYPWLEAKKDNIHMNPIVAAPTPLRNKSEFTFGYRYLFNNIDTPTVTDETKGGPSSGISEETTTPVTETVKVGDDILRLNNVQSNHEEGETCDRVPACGFLVTGWAGGVCRPHCCSNIPAEHCMIVDILDLFLQQTSKLPVYDLKTHKGFWRLLTIRTSRRTCECMITIQHTSPICGGEGDDSDSCAFSKRFEIERDQLVSVLKDKTLQIADHGEPIRITSIFFQEFSGVSSPTSDHPVQVNSGFACMIECVCTVFLTFCSLTLVIN